ncbi:hypothetical protein E0Z10_g5304 [Xylaria hypoxylon]|uniref:Uncharacterized protein n=1 Tax=Xylaria hypoxylon TaxID=37992 RepID=A0A4Z0YWA9_9PEZI|nr:hypothetical protein E0Z10_g5304 [Xylaria hypoxylon]
MSNIGINNPLSQAQAALRVARPTDSIASLIPFYVDGLGFHVTATFNGRREGYQGVLLALPPSSPSAPSPAYHLQFTQYGPYRGRRAPTQDNLLVFFMPDWTLYQRALARMARTGFEPVRSFSPYWARYGTTFEDPDGYRVVLANTRSPL